MLVLDSKSGDFVKPDACKVVMKMVSFLSNVSPDINFGTWKFFCSMIRISHSNAIILTVVCFFVCMQGTLLEVRCLPKETLLTSGRK